MLNIECYELALDLTRDYSSIMMNTVALSRPPSDRANPSQSRHEVPEEIGLQRSFKCEEN